MFVSRVRVCFQVAVPPWLHILPVPLQRWGHVLSGSQISCNMVFSVCFLQIIVERVVEGCGPTLGSVSSRGNDVLKSCLHWVLNHAMPATLEISV